MSQNRTAADFKADAVASMGTELGEQYAALWQAHAGACEMWNEYVELFGTKESRVDILNGAAPHTFRVIQDTLWREIILHLARMTDPPKSVGKPNLTVQAIPPLITESIFGKEIQCEVDDCIAKTKFCRDWRNRAIAHADLALALSDSASPLAPASREKVQQALNAVSTLINSVSKYFQTSETAFGHASIIGNALGLLFVLAEGLDAQKTRRDRLAKGEYDPGDFNPREI